MLDEQLLKLAKSVGQTAHLKDVISREAKDFVRVIDPSAVFKAVSVKGFEFFVVYVLDGETFTMKVGEVTPVFFSVHEYFYPALSRVLPKHSMKRYGDFISGKFGMNIQAGKRERRSLKDKRQSESLKGKRETVKKPKEEKSQAVKDHERTLRKEKVERGQYGLAGAGRGGVHESDKDKAKRPDRKQKHKKRDIEASKVPVSQRTPMEQAHYWTDFALRALKAGMPQAAGDHLKKAWMVRDPGLVSVRPHLEEALHLVWSPSPRAADWVVQKALDKIKAKLVSGSKSASAKHLVKQASDILKSAGGPTIAPTATVTPTAKVEGNAKVLDNAKVVGNAKVFRYAEVYEDAKVGGNAVVTDFAQVFGYAKVMEWARVFGKADVGGNANVLGEAMISGSAKVSGNASVSANAKVFQNAKVSGNAKIGISAHVYGKAQVSERAEVLGGALVYDNAKVYGNAVLYGLAEIFGNAHVYGNAKVYGDSKIGGTAMVYGDAQIGGTAEILGGKWNGSEGPIMSGRWLAPGVPA